MPWREIKLKETLEECARRELLEETGLMAKTVTYLGVIRELQDGYNFIHFAFWCNNYEGKIELKEPEKCLGWKFFGRDSLPAETLPAHLAGTGLLKGAIRNYLDLLM